MDNSPVESASSAGHCRDIIVLGSTGSIGTQTLDVIGSSPDRFEVAAIGSGSSVAELAAQAGRWHPQVVAIAD